MERPGFESPLCALSTNRSLSATIRKLPLDRCAFFHRRMTYPIFNYSIFRNLLKLYPVFRKPAAIPLIVAAMACCSESLVSPLRFLRRSSTWIRLIGST